MKDLISKIIDKIQNNPKLFYLYFMNFLVISFLFLMISSIFFENKESSKLFIPIIKYENKNTKDYKLIKEQKMEKIILELQELKSKKENNNLTKNDSIRIDYLFNEYQKLK